MCRFYQRRLGCQWLKQTELFQAILSELFIVCPDPVERTLIENKTRFHLAMF